MASILEKRKVEIREAVEKAGTAFKEKDYETALKILQPYRSDKKVQKVIAKIEAVWQESKSARKTKTSPEVNYGYVIGIVLAACGLLFIAGTFLNNDSPRSAEPTTRSTQFAEIYYSSMDGAYVRACTQGDCEILAALPAGEEVDFIEIAQGATINESSLWYRVLLSDGREGYIHSTVVSTVRPTPAPTRRPQVNPQPTQPPAPQVEHNWNCSGNRYDCDDLSYSEVISYWNSCPGDPSNLDGDSDGIPCENN